MGAGKSRRSARHGRKRALRELSLPKILGGIKQGLSLAPEFFGLLSSPKFEGTPLGQGLEIQRELGRTALAGLRGESFPLPSGVASAAREQIGGQLAALGIETSPAAAIAATERLTGISEQIRGVRIAQALSILHGGGGAGSLFPTTSEFLNLSANVASQRAGIQFQSGQVLSQIAAGEEQTRNKLIGLAASAAIGAATGGAGLVPGVAAGFGGAAQGAGLFSGLIPQSFFDRPQTGPPLNAQTFGQTQAGLSALQSPFLLPGT